MYVGSGGRRMCIFSFLELQAGTELCPPGKAVWPLKKVIHPSSTSNLSKNVKLILTVHTGECDCRHRSTTGRRQLTDISSLLPCGFQSSVRGSGLPSKPFYLVIHLTDMTAYFSEVTLDVSFFHAPSRSLFYVIYS